MNQIIERVAKSMFDMDMKDGMLEDQNGLGLPSLIGTQN